MNGLVSRARRVFSKAAALSDQYARQSNPEEEPYKSKYAGRSVLDDARAQLLELRSEIVHYQREEEDGAASSSPQDLEDSSVFDALFPDQVDKGTALKLMDDLVARIDRRLGVNYVQTEENPYGLQTLSRCVNYLEPRLLDISGLLTDHATSKQDESQSSNISTLHYQDAFKEYMCLAMIVSIAIDVLDANNFLAMLWSGWDENEKALVHLRRAKHSYLRAMKAIGYYCPEYKHLHQAKMESIKEQNDNADKESILWKLHPGLVTIESSYTHTHFYYAQVYGNLGRYYVATKYVESTLYRQLRYQLGVRGNHTQEQQVPVTEEEVERYFQRGTETDEETEKTATTEFLSDLIGTGQVEPLDALDWARNAMRLCTFYLNKSRYTFAAHCLKASEIMLGLEKERRNIDVTNDADLKALMRIHQNDNSSQVTEELLRIEAELHAHWGKLYVSVLEDAYNRERSGASSAAMEDRDEEQIPHFTHASDARARLMEDSIQEHISFSKETTLSSGDTTSEEKGVLENESEDELDGQNVWQSVSTEEAPFVSFIRCSSLNLLKQITHIDQEKSLGTLDQYIPVVRITLPDNIRDFPSARDVFKAASKHIYEALEFFVLDGFVTDHVGLLSDLSKLYKYIALWEEDPKREQVMHSRRIQILGPLLDILNPSIYMDIHKQVALEMGRTAQECLDLRIQRVEQKKKTTNTGPKKSDINSINKLADLSLGFHNHFIRCYDDKRFRRANRSPEASSESENEGGDQLPPVLPAPDSTIAPSVDACVPEGAQGKYDTGNYAVGNLNEPLLGATSLDDGSVEAYLTAHFCIARVLTKRVDPSTREQDLIQSLKRSEWLLEVAPAIIPKDDPEMFSEELSLTREHTSLLREKIDYLHFRGVEL
eukprot:gb/GECG01001188.1/.p1 GENE.gb/GECG01001188.1/~~gb/GECG01001188.1/.p1  ORF type:complete len:886 (+),score=109.53 gb/GECG01001188.1/:1-2658(+)